MTLCRWFGFLDPDDLKRAITPRVYFKWFRYYERNACHPQALPLTVGLNTLVQISPDDRKKNNIKLGDLVCHLNEKVAAELADPDEVSSVFDGMMGEGNASAT